MSPKLKTRRNGQVRPARYRSLQLPVLLWLTLVWVVLWGHISVLTVLGGFVVAVIACFVFPLPPLRLDVRVRPVALVWLVVRFAIDVIVSSVQVAWVVVRPSRPPRNAVVAVNLRTPSDFVLTVVAEMTCLIPGSIVIEARRSTHTLFLHVLDVGDEAGADHFRQRVLDQEARLVRALGHHVDHLDDATPVPGGAR
ncbi:Na+/H+ antiporter subunit E [Aeromicrobium sp. SMF47]|uniref:Na+/H+ antiporter subunit E n=1 Tax=Aeromicrobium yanjiei TaxID=2662028 RepID=A0A5Q2MPS6_9ACTN|nr:MULTISPECIES: Na+/H+ antiporter subunit E [Aeromicrobium]MRJ76144.1 Na+/H+ antiporter subunit E [Aeromicrobium yanjiei]MRK00494.1 Na+/H+ antiporter subunit E [Aeromicrobium sp. S22]QGG42665.1 Na+/H+ antiporter subunit E [Aeromicrobium yanjiei]